MKQRDIFGIGRSLEPKGALPQPAWRLDNTMTLRPEELLVQVSIICVNMVSFREIQEETGFNDALFIRRIMDIIRVRGKLHNPVTGTGGMFYGKVLEMGENYPNRDNVAVGDEIISLTSLSVTPLALTAIHTIDYDRALLEVEGRCILYGTSPIIKRPEDLPIRLVIASMDEAGAPTRTYRTVRQEQKILILGATGKAGLLCAYAARDKLQGTGCLVGLVKGDSHYEKAVASGLFDQVVQADAGNIVQFYQGDGPQAIGDQYDVVINCVNSTPTELVSLLAVRPGGIVYFATLCCDYKFAALTAESIGKEVTIIPYTGLLAGHAQYTLDLLRRNATLCTLLEHGEALPKGEVNAIDPDIVALPMTQMEGEVSLGGYIFRSQESKLMLAQALKVSRYNSNVLIYGESGVGKEIIARTIHQNSERKSFPMVKINCAAIPENLLESELFGYERGAFTGANTKGKMGLWEAAQNGTLFLDEVGELPLSFQAKLLRVIQEKEIVRVGGITPIKVDVRIIAATNRNLAKMVALRLFREDLYYRLNVYPVAISPLRERKADIIPLASHFVERYNEEFGMKKTISDSALRFLATQPLKGNIRELQNVLQRLMITSEDNEIQTGDIMRAMTEDAWTQEGRSVVPPQGEAAFSGALPVGVTLKEHLRHTEEALLRAHWKNHSSTRKMAAVLGMSQPTVVRKLRQFGIVVPQEND